MMDERTKNLLWPSNILRMAICWMTALVYSYLQLFLRKVFGSLKVYPHHSLPHCHRHPKPVCIITGAATGLGRSTAETLAIYGYHVILAGRSVAPLSKIVADIQQKHYGTCLKALELDLCSEESILKFKESVEDWLKMSGFPQSIQLLVNNAGVLKTTRTFTRKGYDSMMASNYLGAFKLTHALLPLLHSSKEPSRIVNVTSFTHRCVHKLQVDKMQLATGDMQGISRFDRYGIAHIYEASKLCLLLFTFELHRQLYVTADRQPVSVMAADPGAVNTCIWRELPHWLTWLTFRFLSFFCLLQSPEEGSSSILDAALASPELSGLYFFGGCGRTLDASNLAFDKDVARTLWEVSSALLEVKQ